MSLWRIAWRYLWSRPLLAILSLAGVALGGALISAVLTLRRESERAFTESSGVYDLVVGAKGSPLQLVLSSVCNMDVPTGNIPYSRFEALKADSRVRLAVPIGLGDNYRSYRIVGTTNAMLEVQRAGGTGKPARPLLEVGEGRWFEGDFEAVAGAEAARQAGLELERSFAGTHGLAAVKGSEEHKAFPYRVVGVLKPTGTPADRAIYASLESVWRIHDKEDELHREIAGVQSAPVIQKPRETTAVLLQLKAMPMRWAMAQEINKNTESMAAIPVNEMLRLSQQALAPMQRALLAVASVVVLVSALTVVTMLSQAAERRRRDLAILRSIGAHPGEIFFLILFEAVWLTALGIALGWLLGHGGVALASIRMQSQMGFSLNAWTFDPAEFRAFAVVACAGLAAGIVPAILAYRRAPSADLAAS